jgi:group I intron endonuclease
MDNSQKNQTPIHTIVKNIKGNTTNKGIYKITCLTNNKFYIGSSMEISARIKAHFNFLRTNKHINKNLQKAYNEFGELSFKVECIESVCKKTDYKNLILLEQKYLDTLKPYNENIGFNRCKIAAKPPCRAGAIFTEEHKRNIAAAQKERHRLKDCNYTSPLKGKTAKEIHGPNWVDPRTGREMPALKRPDNWGKKDLTMLTLVHVQTNHIMSKTCYEWRKEGIDVHALKCGRQITSKFWSLYNSCCPP